MCKRESELAQVGTGLQNFNLQKNKDDETEHNKTED
jgi:hypothetical protein